MHKVALLTVIFFRFIDCSRQQNYKSDVSPQNSNFNFQYLPPPVVNIRPENLALKSPIDFGGDRRIYAEQPGISIQQAPTHDPAVQSLANTNPLFAAFLLGSSLGIKPQTPGYNHPQHLPINPYLVLLLSHYGRYLSIGGHNRGIYGYTAANNFHNNLPFGAYKIYEDRDV